MDNKKIKKIIKIYRRELIFNYLRSTIDSTDSKVHEIDDGHWTHQPHQVDEAIWLCKYKLFSSVNYYFVGFGNVLCEWISSSWKEKTRRGSHLFGESFFNTKLSCLPFFVQSENEILSN